MEVAPEHGRHCRVKIHGQQGMKTCRWAMAAGESLLHKYFPAKQTYFTILVAFMVWQSTLHSNAWLKRISHIILFVRLQLKNLQRFQIKTHYFTNPRLTKKMTHHKLCFGLLEFSSKKKKRLNFENLNINSCSHVRNWAVFSLKSLKWSFSYTEQATLKKCR